MNRYLAMEPQTDAELFDMLHGLFGIGDFDEDDERPWHRFRITEISKIKAMRTKRHISLADFALAARYAYRHRMKINNSWQLPPQILEARREAKATAVSDLSQEIQAAIDAESSSGRPDSEWWVERLMRAAGPYRREVLDEWLEHANKG